MQVPQIMNIPTRRNRVLAVFALLAFLPLAVAAQPPAENAIAGPPMSLAAQIDLETALQWTLQSNPNLVATRQNERVSAEAVAVSRYFPTSLNPSISVTYTPWVFEPRPTAWSRISTARSR